MWAFGVVMDAPFFDDDLYFSEVVEDLTIQTFIPEFAVEGFAIAIHAR